MKYVANPGTWLKSQHPGELEVEAHKIVSVGQPNADCSVHVALENGENEIATSGMCSRYKPVAGDYWVIQSDGYTYLNPKEVFERKYHAVET